MVFLGGGGSGGGGGEAQGGHLYEMGDLMCSLAVHLMCVIITQYVALLWCCIVSFLLQDLCMEFVVFTITPPLPLQCDYSTYTITITYMYYYNMHWWQYEWYVNFLRQSRVQLAVSLVPRHTFFHGCKKKLRGEAWLRGLFTIASIPRVCHPCCYRNLRLISQKIEINFTTC